MYGQVHGNTVFYKDRPEAGHRYRQIVVVERNQFEVRIFEGDVIQEAPFDVDNPDAEIYLHADLKSAVADAKKEAADTAANGWIRYA